MDMRYLISTIMVLLFLHTTYYVLSVFIWDYSIFIQGRVKAFTMEGWLERTLRGLNSLPTEVTDSLSQIREKGVENRNLAKSIQDEEMALLEELQEAIRTGADIDESSIKTRADALVQRRKDLSVHMDMQTKAASSIYEKCGECSVALSCRLVLCWFVVLCRVGFVCL